MSTPETAYDDKEAISAIRQLKEAMARAHAAGAWDILLAYCSHATSINDVIDAVDGAIANYDGEATGGWELRVYHSQAHEPDVTHKAFTVPSVILQIKMYSPEEYPLSRIYVLAPNDASDEQIAVVRAAFAARGDDRTDLVQRWNELQA